MEFEYFIMTGTVMVKASIASTSAQKTSPTPLPDKKPLRKKSLPTLKMP
jgi:hypothetical protein